MAENNVAVNTESNAKKRVRVGYIFLALVPFAIIMAVQTIATIPGVVLAVIETVKSGQSYDLAAVMEVFNSKYALITYSAYCVICLGVFIPWYYKGIVKKSPKVNYKKALGIRSWALSVSVMMCLYFVVSGAFTVLYKLIPQIMEKYDELIQMSSIGTNVLMTIVYVILLGPLTEELCYRGLMFGILEKSNANHVLLICIQGALFAIMHMNLVQGGYAFLLGIILGFLRYRYRTIIITVSVHMLFNLVGTFGAQYIDGLGLNDNLTILFGGIAVVIAAFMMIFIVKDKNVYTKEQDVIS
jgi:membrane protease YdiL (CAAX protease family)